VSLCHAFRRRYGKAPRAWLSEVRSSLLPRSGLASAA
jgi:hypothetical protein